MMITATKDLTGRKTSRNIMRKQNQRKQKQTIDHAACADL